MNRDDDYFDYLRRLDLDQLAQRVDTFWAAPREDDSRIFQRFVDVLSVEGPEGSIVRYTNHSLSYPAGQTMWRVRQVHHGSDGAVIPKMNREADLWEAPAHFVSARGRLNDVGESVLYVSIGDPVVAMREARVPAGERFALIRYETARPVTLTAIAPDLSPDWLPDELIDAHNAVTAFYRDVFTREFAGDTWTYALSNRVAKDWHDLPERIADGWSFPSIAHGKGINAAFRPEKAHQVLTAVGVAYCEAVESALLGWRIQAFAFSPGPEGPGDFRWLPMGSLIQQEQFPDFRS